MRIPDESDDDFTLEEFAKSFIVPRAKILYNLMDNHVTLIHKRLPAIIKEARRKHTTRAKGVDYQFFVAGGILYTIVEGVITAVATVSSLTSIAAAGGGLITGVGEGAVAVGETAAAIAEAAAALGEGAGAVGEATAAVGEAAEEAGLLAEAGETVEGAAEVAEEVEEAAELAKQTETLGSKAGYAFKTAAKKAASGVAIAAAGAAGEKIVEVGKDKIQKFVCDKLSYNLLGKKGGCPKKDVQLKRKKIVPDSGPEQATPCVPKFGNPSLPIFGFPLLDLDMLKCSVTELARSAGAANSP